MRIVLTLEEVQLRCNDWEQFCKKEGWNEWAVNEGGGDIKVYLTEQQATEYGLIRSWKFNTDRQ